MLLRPWCQIDYVAVSVRVNPKGNIYFKYIYGGGGCDLRSSLCQPKHANKPNWPRQPQAV